MKKKNLTFSIVLIFAGIIFGVFFINTYSKLIVLTPEQIQKKLDEKFPISKTKFFIEFNFKEPKVLLEEGSDRLGFGINVKVTTPKITINKNQLKNTFNGTLYVEGKINYSRQTGAFYLNAPEVKKLEIKEIPDKYMEKINKFIKPYIEKYVDSHPIYTLKPKSIKQELARIFLKKVYVEDNKLMILIGAEK